MLGCAAAPEAPETARVPADAAYLLDPLTGYGEPLPEAAAASLRAGHRALVMESDVEGALAAAAALPSLAPAAVLRAQALLVGGDLVAARDLALPVASADPGYDAAQLVAGRAAERTDRLVEAFVAYATLAPRSALAAERFRALRPRAMDILARRITDALGRERLDEAGRELEILQRWAPQEERTLVLSLDVAERLGDSDAELRAARELARLRPEDVELLVRQARLERDVGDPGTALRLLQRLTDERPDDAGIASELARARFVWRLGLLPPKITRLARVPELTRAEMAALVYWLFPSVRYGQAESATIANDVLDHPHRQEIVRVANLGIMGVDPRLHRFAPEQLLDRRSALLTVLRALARHEPAPSCLYGSSARLDVSAAGVCDLAARCGLLAGGGECSPGVTAAGADVLEWTRRALDRLAAE